jgi:1-acyl-sn-glycerol-3-phosphate acyltransferase
MLYRIARGILKPIFYLYYNIRVEGRENLPSKGPLIICANHFSTIDPVILAVTLPYIINSMAKAELFKNKLLSLFFTNINVFPVKRGEPDLKSIKTALKILKENKVMGMFPEGTRNKTGELKAEPGIAMIAIKGKAQVLPIAIVSNYKLFKKTIVKIGKPILLNEYFEQKLQSEDYHSISMDIMKYIKLLSEDD